MIKDSSIRTDEAPLEHFFFAISISDWIANMENLAFISHISIITVRSSITSEFVYDIIPDSSRVAWKSQSSFSFVLFAIIVVFWLSLKEKDFFAGANDIKTIWAESNGAVYDLICIILLSRFNSRCSMINFKVNTTNWASTKIDEQTFPICRSLQPQIFEDSLNHLYLFFFINLIPF